MTEKLMNVAEIPKIELHLHLEGAAPPALVSCMAKQKKIDLSKIFSSNGNYKCEGFKHFLNL